MKKRPKVIRKWPIAIEIGDRCGKGRTCGNLGKSYQSLGDYQKETDYHGKRLKIAVEIGDRARKIIAYRDIVTLYFSLKPF